MYLDWGIFNGCESLVGVTVSSAVLYIVDYEYFLSNTLARPIIYCEVGSAARQFAIDNGFGCADIPLD